MIRNPIQHLMMPVFGLRRCGAPAVRPTIFFDSHDVSKPDSVSLLSILDDDEGSGRPRAPPIKADSIDKLVAMLRPALGMALFGVDVVVEKTSGLCAIIDINAFPGAREKS